MTCVFGFVGAGMARPRNLAAAMPFPGSMTSIAPYGLYVNAVARGVEDAAPYRDGCLLFQCKQQLPQYLAGRSGRNAALV